MKHLLLLFGGLLMLLPRLTAQSAQGMLTKEQEKKIVEVEDTLEVMNHLMFNDTSSANRFAACRDLITGLVRALKVENSFDYKFERLKYVSIQYPADSSFRVFTWQLYVDKDTYRYYGAIQMNSPELDMFPLIDRSSELRDLEHVALTPDNWYGSVYYRLQEVDAPQGKYYLLFGYDAFTFFQKRKIVETLHFEADGKPVFGSAVFIKEEEGKPAMSKNRLVLEYSSEASVRLNYDPTLDLIIFDHLVYLEGTHGEGRIGVPDGSYEGYRPEKGKWYYEEKIWDEISEQVPRPFPVLDKREGDIFGNQKGKN